MELKQQKVVEKAIGDNVFFIKPFPAFTAAKLSADLTAALGPLLGGLAPLLGSIASDAEETTDIMNAELEDVASSICNAFSSLSGDKFEKLMRELLINNRNISVETPNSSGKATKLDFDTANEVFCGEIQDMYILCFEVIKINFNGFFKKIGNLFGNLQETLQKKMVPILKNTED